MDADEIEVAKLRIREEELAIRRFELAIEFAKFGFRGTLAAGISGLILILALAMLDAYSSNFRFGTEGVLGTAFLLMAGTVLFGTFSLRQPIRMISKFGNMQLDVNTARDAETAEKPGKSRR
jgi:hypothetical protein